MAYFVRRINFMDTKALKIGLVSRRYVSLAFLSTKFPISPFSWRYRAAICSFHYYIYSAWPAKVVSPIWRPFTSFRDTRSSIQSSLEISVKNMQDMPSAKQNCYTFHPVETSASLQLISHYIWGNSYAKILSSEILLTGVSLAKQNLTYIALVTSS